MFLKKKIIAIIPARKNSKGIKNKNLQKIGNQNLVEICVNTAIRSKYIDQIILSSDSVGILNLISEKKIIKHLRKKSLASDNSQISDVLLDILKEYNGDYIILLQPTSPFRRTIDIDNIIKETIQNRRKSVVSVELSKNIPDYMYTINKNKQLKPYRNISKLSTNRQSYKQYFSPNGELYISEIADFKKSKKLINKSTYGYLQKNKISIDIDTIYDLKLARVLFKVKNSI